MKNIFLSLLFLAGSFVSAQNNRFGESEEVNAAEVGQGPGDDTGGGDLEGDDPLPAPIDDYIPLLVIAAMGLIVYQGTRKKVQA